MQTQLYDAQQIILPGIHRQYIFNEAHYFHSMPVQIQHHISSGFVCQPTVLTRYLPQHIVDDNIPNQQTHVQYELRR